MSNKTFENKVNQDIDKLKKDVATLGDDGATGLSRMFAKRADDAKKTVADTVQTVNKAVGQGLSQYNTKIQEVADRVPGDFAKKAAGYPWVTITLSLAAGLLLGVLLKPGRQLVR
jgi:ElaB/YqjD/DUF883 family membrane-anchored ribosome-binding protein